jgi:hypothetical protein
MPNFKSVHFGFVAIAMVTLLTIQSVQVFANSYNNDNDHDDKQHCDPVCSDYQETCFESQVYDDMTGLGPSKDGSQVHNYNDCPDHEEINKDGCYNSGFSDGQDHPFDQIKFDECGSIYYNGFLSGCMSVRGNDLETCRFLSHPRSAEIE